MNPYKVMRWVDLEYFLLFEYMGYWYFNLDEQGNRLLRFNFHLCRWLILFYAIKMLVGLQHRPPVFRKWYVRFTHKFYRRHLL